jgi:uncharacterized RDD family membrane protein YckC
MGDEFNPYEAPRADGQGPLPRAYLGDTLDASRGIRFANLLIDSFFRIIIGGVVGFLLGTSKQPLLNAGLGIGLIIVYYLFFEGLFQATPGKMITGTRVVALDGSRPSFPQIVGRTFARFVPFEPFSFFSSTSEGWHDRWSGTRVVRR